MLIYINADVISHHIIDYLPSLLEEDDKYNKHQLHILDQRKGILQTEEF